jgi:hypothetical protein
VVPSSIYFAISGRELIWDNLLKNVPPHDGAVCAKKKGRVSIIDIQALRVLALSMDTLEDDNQICNNGFLLRQFP